MIRGIVYSAIGIVIGGIIGILVDAGVEGASPSLTIPIIGMALGGIAGYVVALALNRHYELHPVPFAPPPSEKLAPVYISIGADAGMSFFLILFIIVLALLNPSNQSLDAFIASPLPYILDTIIYTASIWIAVWFLKRKGYLQATYSDHALTLNTVFLILLGNIVSGWRAILASPLVSITAFLVTGVVLYVLTRFVLSKTL
jgi:hypothetical protein